jgi:hypothetical protein
VTLLVGLFKLAADAENSYGQCNYILCPEFRIGVGRDVAEAANFRLIGRMQRVTATMGFVLCLAKEFSLVRQIPPHI